MRRRVDAGRDPGESRLDRKAGTRRQRLHVAVVVVQVEVAVQTVFGERHVRYSCQRRRVVHRRDCDIYHGRVRTAVAVGDGVLEAGRAVVVEIGREPQRAIAVIGHRAVGRLGKDVDDQCAGAVVVAEYRQVKRCVLVDCVGIVDGHDRGDVRRVGSAVVIFERQAEAERGLLPVQPRARKRIGGLIGRVKTRAGHRYRRIDQDRCGVPLWWWLHQLGREPAPRDNITNNNLCGAQ